MNNDDYSLHSHEAFEDGSNSQFNEGAVFGLALQEDNESQSMGQVMLGRQRLYSSDTQSQGNTQMSGGEDNASRGALNTSATHNTSVALNSFSHIFRSKANVSESEQATHQFSSSSSSAFSDNNSRYSSAGGASSSSHQRQPPLIGHKRATSIGCDDEEMRSHVPHKRLDVMDSSEKERRADNNANMGILNSSNSVIFSGDRSAHSHVSLISATAGLPAGVSVSNASHTGRLNADFDIHDVVGSGVFGKVYKVMGKIDRTMYAIKASKRSFRGENERQMMINEVYALAALSARDADSPTNFDDDEDEEDDGDDTEEEEEVRRSSGTADASSDSQNAVGDCMSGNDSDTTIDAESSFSLSPVKSGKAKYKRRISSRFGRGGSSNIVRYYGTWIEEDHIYIQMELCETSVENVFNQHLKSIGALPAVTSSANAPQVPSSGSSFGRSHSVTNSYFTANDGGSSPVPSTAVVSIFGLSTSNILAGPNSAKPPVHAAETAAAVSVPSSSTPTPYPFTVRDVLTMSRDILLALAFLHRNDYVHLDIKPGNILIKNNHYKLSDFGLALRVEKEKDDGDSQSNSGSPKKKKSSSSRDSSSSSATAYAMSSSVEEGDTKYMARELLDWGSKDLRKCDIFSLGVSLYEICNGAPVSSEGEEWQNLRNGTYQPQIPAKINGASGLVRNLGSAKSHSHASSHSAVYSSPGTINIASNSAAAGKEMVSIVHALLQPNPVDRPGALQCLAKFPFLQSKLERQLQASKKCVQKLTRQLRLSIESNHSGSRENVRKSGSRSSLMEIGGDDDDVIDENRKCGNVEQLRAPERSNAATNRSDFLHFHVNTASNVTDASAPTGAVAAGVADAGAKPTKGTKPGHKLKRANTVQ